MKRWLHARMTANDEAGWEYVALVSRTEPTLADRVWFLRLRMEHVVLRALEAIVTGGSLSWR